MGRVLDLKALPSGFESHSVLALFYFRLMLFLSLISKHDFDLELLERS